MKKLERRLELPAVVAISISAMLGSGIFVLPGIAAGMAGPSVWAAYLAAGLCVLPAALSKSELATAMPTSGGTYVYLDRAFGPMFGTISGLGLWLSLLLKSSFALVGFGAYLEVFGAVPLRATALALLTLIVALNILGVRQVSRAQSLIVSISVAGIVVVGLAGIPGIEPTHLRNPLPHGLDGFVAATAFVFVAYAGVTKVAAIAEEVKHPDRNLPAGILISLGIVTALYAGIVFVMAGNLPVVRLERSLKPMHDLAEHVGGVGVGMAMAVIGVLTMTSMANAGLLAASRFPFAMSRERLLPAKLHKVHVRYTTPVASIVLSGVFMAAAIVVFDVAGLAKLASSFMIMMYAALNVAVIVLRESGAQWYTPKFRSPAYPWVQIAGVLSGAALLFVIGAEALVAALGIAVPGAVFYVLYGKRRANRQGVFGQRGPRAELLSSTDVPITLGEEFGGEASVVVPLLGNERSPETLVEIGAALADGGNVEVVSLQDVPEQTDLDAVTEEDVHTRSLRRRVSTMAREEGIDVAFDAAVSHDLIKTVHEISARLHCRWIVLEWVGKRRHALTLHNPLGWLRDHLSCNLATFFDAGVRHFKRIIVYCEPGPHDALVATTADNLAATNDAELTFVRFVPRGANDVRRQAAADYLEQVRSLCDRPSEALLVDGDSPSTITATTGDFDLLVMAGRRESRTWGALLGSKRDELTFRSECSVLRLRTPRAETHRAFDRRGAARGSGGVDVVDFLQPGCLAARAPIKRRQALFAHIARVFAERLPGIASSRIDEALQERERTQSTAVGEGIALPHATLSGVEGTLVGVFTTSSPLDYQAPDGVPVDVFIVMIGGPGDRSMHLQVLSTVAALLRKTPLADRLRAATSKEALVEALVRSGSELD